MSEQGSKIGTYAWDDHDASNRHNPERRTIIRRISIDLQPNTSALPWALSFLDSYRKMYDPNDRYLNKMAVVVDENPDYLTAVSLIDGCMLYVYQYVEREEE